MIINISLDIEFDGDSKNLTEEQIQDFLRANLDSPAITTSNVKILSVREDD